MPQGTELVICLYVGGSEMGKISTYFDRFEGSEIAHLFVTELSSRSQVVFFQCCHGRGHKPIPKMNHESPPKWKDLGVVFVHMFRGFFLGGGNIFNRRIFSAKWFNYQLIPCSLKRLACGIVSIDTPYWSTSIYIYIYTYICIYLYTHIQRKFGCETSELRTFKNAQSNRFVK